MKAKTSKGLDQQTARFVATIACNLPSLTNEEMQAWINKPKEIKKYLAGLRREPAEVPKKVISLNTWKTIKLGTGIKTADDFRREIKHLGCKIGAMTDEILGKAEFITHDEEIEVDLVIKSVAELGFASGATCKQIYERAIELGFVLCPFEVGLQLRLQYLDQPKDEWLHIAMEPINLKAGVSCVFYVGHDDQGKWLYVYDGDDNSRRGMNDRWVFVEPRK